jgi:general secretion pathway protein K
MYLEYGGRWLRWRRRNGAKRSAFPQREQIGMPKSRADRGDRGFIIVAVLWILVALATLSLIYALYVREAALNFVAHDERLQTEALAESGVELAAYQLTKETTQPPQGSFSFRQGTAAVAVKFRCENSLIDLNFAPKELLAGFFAGIGAQHDDALAFADRIIAWRKPLRPGETDSEAGVYAAAGKTYGPRHAPFEDPDELGLVAGKPAINVLAAPPSVLAALPGVTPERLQAMLDLRASASPDALKAQFGSVSSDVTFDPSRANRVTVDVRYPGGQRMVTQAIIFLAPGGTNPYRVLSWRTDVPSIDKN